MPAKSKAVKPFTPARTAQAKPRLRQTGEARYRVIRKALERDHFGSYVMINTDTCDYVVGPTTSQVHAAFIDRFVENAPGWCTRIGASVFATA